MPAVVDSTYTSARSYHNGKRQKLSVPVIQPYVQPVQIHVMASAPSDKSALTYLGLCTVPTALKGKKKLYCT